MQTPALNNWWLRIATFMLAALAAASAAFWVLKWMASGVVSPSGAVVVASLAPIDPQAVARLLGGGQAAITAVAPVNAAPGRFKLTGVVADGARGGYALIAVDGQAARPYRVGAPVSDALVLRSVAPRSAALAASVEAPVSLTLELPALTQP